MKQLSQEEIRLSRERHVTWMARVLCVALFGLYFHTLLNSIVIEPIEPNGFAFVSAPSPTQWGIAFGFVLVALMLFPLARYGRVGGLQ